MAQLYREIIFSFCLDYQLVLNLEDFFDKSPLLSHIIPFSSFLLHCRTPIYIGGNIRKMTDDSSSVFPHSPGILSSPLTIPLTLITTTNSVLIQSHINLLRIQMSFHKTFM